METKDPALSRRLSGVDAAFIYLERKEIPLGVAAVCVFGRAIPFRAFVRNMDARMRLLPRCRQVVVAPPYDAGYPTWEDDPHFDIRRHIHQVHLEAPGGQAELEALSGRILSQLLDRSMPLWDIHVVDRLERGRGALIVRIHHSLVDGISGMAFLNALFDSQPEGPEAIVEPPARTPHRPAPEPSLAGAIASGLRSSLEHLIEVEAGVLEITKTLWDDVKEAASLLPEMLGAVERLPFNKPCGGDRKFCWADFDFSEAQAIRASAGGSVNDVVLAVLTRAISRYVELHGQTVVNRLIRVVCPVNIRREDDKTAGNQISFLPVVLPLDLEDPVRMLQAVTARTAIMKRSRAADLVALAASWLGVAPPPVQAMLWRGISGVTLPLPLFNIICTNVPGPREPLYCLGRRMIASYPQVPTGYELGINCAVQTYCGRLSFGLIADAQVAPDVTRLRDFLYETFDELCRATGVRKAARRPRPRRAKTSRPAEPAPEPAAAVRGKRPRRAKPAEPAAPTVVEPAPEAVAAVPPAPESMNAEASA
jgi:diacylglycerol O-acyltransferase